MSRKKKASTQIQPLSFSNYIIKNARKLELLKCWKSDTSEGMGHFVVARQRKNGTLVVGVYLIDLYCLGLKDTFYSEFEDLGDLNKKLIEASRGIVDFEEIESNLCFNYIYGAIEYAEDIGFQPHKEFKVTEYILDEVDDIEFVDIEFGHKGQPMFIAGEDDNVTQILATLDKTVGEGNYEYVLGEDFEDEDEENSEDFYDELEDLRELSDEEFEVQTQLSFAKYSDEVKPTYAAFLLIHLALSAWKKVEACQSEYKKNPKLFFTKALEYLLPKLPEGMRDSNIASDFITVSIENTIRFEGQEFFLLEDFQTAFEAFQKGELRENYEVISIFMIPFEIHRMQAIMGIRGYFSEELFQESEFESLNTFQKNRVADLFLETLEEYKLKGLINEEYEDLEDTLDDYLEITEFMPELSQKELKNMILTMVMPEVEEG